MERYFFYLYIQTKKAVLIFRKWPTNFCQNLYNFLSCSEIFAWHAEIIGLSVEFFFFEIDEQNCLTAENLFMQKKKLKKKISEFSLKLNGNIMVFKVPTRL